MSASYPRIDYFCNSGDHHGLTPFSDRTLYRTRVFGRAIDTITCAFAVSIPAVVPVRPTITKLGAWLMLYQPELPAVASIGWMWMNGQPDEISELGKPQLWVIACEVSRVVSLHVFQDLAKDNRVERAWTERQSARIGQRVRRDGHAGMLILCEQVDIDPAARAEPGAVAIASDVQYFPSAIFGLERELADVHDRVFHRIFHAFTNSKRGARFCATFAKSSFAHPSH